MVAEDPALDPGLGSVERAALTSDAYVFYTQTSGKVDMFDPDTYPEYRFLADLEPCTDGWKWTAFAIVEVDELLDLPQVANKITAPPDPPDETATPTAFGPRAMRRTRHFRYFGFARLQVEPRRAEEVLRAINDDTTPGYSGSAMVRGKFRIIVELGSDESHDEVCDRLKQLQVVPGVIENGVEAARVTGLEYYYRPRKQRVGEPEEAA
jgi:hypothetical protein